jgi:hypothetical protein
VGQVPRHRPKHRDQCQDPLPRVCLSTAFREVRFGDASPADPTQRGISQAAEPLSVESDAEPIGFGPEDPTGMVTDNGQVLRRRHNFGTCSEI